jgi:hypothetical protein
LLVDEKTFNELLGGRTPAPPAVPATPSQAAVQ